MNSTSTTDALHQHISPSEGQNDTTNVGQTERILSTFGGGALALYGILRLDWTGAALALLGGGLLYRGISGRSPLYRALDRDRYEMQPLSTTITRLPGGHGIRIRRSLTIDRSPHELYTFWRRIENTPLYTNHVESAIPTGEKTSHWTGKTRSGEAVEWNVELLRDVPEEVISWHAQGNPPIANEGTITFTPAPGNRGTIATLELDYARFGGPLVNVLGPTLGKVAEYETLETLRRFKEMTEAGEVPSTKSQPTGEGRK
jgi:uncharacterized membrane protein